MVFPRESVRYTRHDAFKLSFDRAFRLSSKTPQPDCQFLSNFTAGCFVRYTFQTADCTDAAIYRNSMRIERLFFPSVAMPRCVCWSASLGTFNSLALYLNSCKLRSIESEKSLSAQYHLYKCRDFQLAACADTRLKRGDGLKIVFAY